MGIFKGTKIYSIFTGTCPKCHKGKIYEEKKAWKLRKVLKMNEHCSHCGLKFMIEPAFFYGAMYVSYAVGTAIATAAFIISYFFLNINIDYTFAIIILSLIITFPYILRLSRNIWLNIFLKYDKNLAAKKEENNESF